MFFLWKSLALTSLCEGSLGFHLLPRTVPLSRILAHIAYEIAVRHYPWTFLEVRDDDATTAFKEPIQSIFNS